MDMVLDIAEWLLPLVYMALAIDYGATFILRTRTHARNPGVVAAILLHLAYIVLRGIKLGGPPLVTNAEVLSVVALSSTIVYWAIERFTRDRRAGVFVFMLIFLCQYTASFLPAAAPYVAAEAAMHYRWSRLHIVPASLAYTAMAFATLYALLFLIGQRNLKQHRFGLLFDRLPPLELLGRMCWQALLVGIVFMTVAIITGVMMFHSGGASGAPETKVIVKIVMGSMAWLAYGTAVLGRWLAKWPLPRIAAIAVAGALIVVVLFVTSIALS
ncbi:MAG: cytochrome c biogenesis protein CcsA [Phycisphaerae bacterium]|nr:cytochrome c biogenesis protein CcsA [Phycisphaerae bacterium]